MAAGDAHQMTRCFIQAQCIMTWCSIEAQRITSGEGQSKPTPHPSDDPTFHPTHLSRGPVVSL
jgi:hypothetical protein